MSILVIAEHDNESLNASTLSTLAAAAEIGGDVTVLVAGHKCECSSDRSASGRWC